MDPDGKPKSRFHRWNTLPPEVSGGPRLYAMEQGVEAPPLPTMLPLISNEGDEPCIIAMRGAEDLAPGELNLVQVYAGKELPMRWNGEGVMVTTLMGVAAQRQAVRLEQQKEMKTPPPSEKKGKKAKEAATLPLRLVSNLSPNGQQAIDRAEDEADQAATRNRDRRQW